MSYWRECPRCGAKLDSGELCDCTKKKIVTMEEWEAAGDLGRCVAPGDFVEDRIVDAFVNDMPPVSLGSYYVQGGEPKAHAEDPRTKRWRPVFWTFSKTGNLWRFCGFCFVGERKEPPEMQRRREAATA